MEHQDYYDETLKKFENILILSTELSQEIAGRFVETRKGWASIIFTRMCTTAVSVGILAPESNLAEKLEHWDCVSLCSLARNLMECYHTFFYFCIDSINEEEWKLRYQIFCLHDRKSRFDMLNYFGDNQEEQYNKVYKEVVEQLENNTLFVQLDEKTKKRYLKGDNAFLISREEIEEKIGEDRTEFKGWYKFLSNQTHSFPMSFSRMSEQNKGKGLKSDIEVGYSATALEISLKYLILACKDIIEIFPDTKPKFEERLKGEI